MHESEQKQPKGKEVPIFPSSNRKLLNNKKPISPTQTTLHDTINPSTTFLPTTPITNPVTAPVAIPSTPITNPVTTPIAVPSTNPTPTFVTVPSTNPVTVPPTNPITTPVTNPITTPITCPSTNPITPSPMLPTTNPLPPPGGNPIMTPVTTPSPPVTVSPVVSGQSWCVVKTGVLDNALQIALDYACGTGGADCSAIQQMGPCYNPNTLRDHASYAFNSYYQKNPARTSCDFGGIAMTVTTNPSYGSCVYPSSSSSSLLSSSPPSSVLNITTPPAAPTTISIPPPPETVSPVVLGPPVTVTPVVSGQSWCVAKTGALDNALQIALDYACGTEGAECSAIQQTGPCYNPNTLRDHASYAFNSYYQKNPGPTSCNFGGTAMTVTTNPSYGSCIYPSSSSSSLLSSSPSSSVLNISNPASSTTATIFASQPPTGATASGASISVHLQLLLTLFSITTTIFASVQLMEG
ncbi:uncharacterized protein LOC143881358 isoform X2 [Tasmannia lanceolata]